jgi:hypothetical protein
MGPDKDPNWRALLAQTRASGPTWEAKARAEITDGETGRYAAEIAEHKRDPYSLVEKIVSRVGGET